MRTTITTAKMKEHGVASLGSEFCCAIRGLAFMQKQAGQHDAADLTQRLAADIQVLLNQYKMDMANLNLAKG